MIIKIYYEEPVPINQKGTINLFSRLNYSYNEINQSMSKEDIYDLIFNHAIYKDRNYATVRVVRVLSGSIDIKKTKPCPKWWLF